MSSWLSSESPAILHEGCRQVKKCSMAPAQWQASMSLMISRPDCNWPNEHNAAHAATFMPQCMPVKQVFTSSMEASASSSEQSKRRTRCMAALHLPHTGSWTAERHTCTCTFSSKSRSISGVSFNSPLATLVQAVSWTDVAIISRHHFRLTCTSQKGGAA